MPRLVGRAFFPKPTTAPNLGAGHGKNLLDSTTSNGTIVTGIIIARGLW